MNYRHIYHAGNICDVVKHSVLTLVMEHLRQKETPFCVIDTHAGIGVYDLHDLRAAKTNEAVDGILKLLDAPRLPELADFYSVLQKLNLEWDGHAAARFRYYPGSPVLALHMLRPQDRMIASELHPEDAAELKRQLFPFRQAQVHHRDGYEALGAFVPPAEKRGLALIDPPFEEPNEFDRLANALQHAHTRWPQGIFMAWYPIKERATIWHFHEQLIGTNIVKILAAEFIYHEETVTDRLNGSGLILINPPWQMDAKLQALFSALHNILKVQDYGDKIQWLTDQN